MADHTRAANIADDDGQFDRPALLRLGAWGLAAVFALTTMMLAARSDLGAMRLNAAFAAIAASPTEPPQAMVNQLLSRTADVEREARRLTESVRSLTTERDRLTTRLGSVEREMGDLTGSIARTLPHQANLLEPRPMTSYRPADAPPPATTVAKLTPAASGAAGSNAPGEAEAASAPAQAENVPLPQPRLNQPAPSAAEAADAAGPPAEKAASPTAPHVVTTVAVAPGDIDVKSAEAPQPKAEIGLDLGPALTMARLRARWTAFKASHAAMAEKLRPVISIREMGANKPIEMRLVVGPVPDVHAAAQMCAALVGTQFACHPAVFDGQRLALR